MKNKVEFEIFNTTIKGVKILSVSLNHEKHINKYLFKSNVKNLSLEEIDCEFNFRGLDKLGRLLIFDSNLQNKEHRNIIENLSNLKDLRLIDTNFPKGFDFSTFNRLEKLELNWDKTYNLSNLSKLNELILRKCGADNLKNIKGLNNLEVLELIQGKISSLDGLENFNNLKALLLYNLKNLTFNDIEIISKLRNLEYLHIKNFKDKIDLAVLQNNKKLKWLNLESCLQVVNFNSLE